MKHLIIFLIFIHLLFPKDAVFLSSLDWPPYTYNKLHNQGFVTYLVKQTFDKAKIKANVDFFPWQRTLYYGKESSKYIGYFPEYYSPSIEKSFYFSNPIGSSPLGIIYNREKPLSWNKIEDLKKYKIGVVNGYVNTIEIDKLINQGKLKIEGVTSDIQNIQKVSTNRIDLAIIDFNTFNFYMNNSPNLKKMKNNVIFHEKLLEEKNIYICFIRTPEGLKYRNLFNEALKSVDVNKIQKEYLNDLLKVKI